MTLLECRMPEPPRKPNTKCKRCEKPIYRRPSDQERYTEGVFCGRDCYSLDRWGRLPYTDKRFCEQCGVEFVRMHNSRKAKFCSKSCSNLGRRGIKYTGDRKENSSKRRLSELRKEAGFLHCMIEGCEYEKVLDVHRLIPGHKGGSYEAGNMFAICPNHHAEHTRGITILVKVSEFMLRSLPRVKTCR